MKNVLFLLLISSLFTACSTPEEKSALDESVVFEDVESSDLDDVNFGEDDEDDEFAGLEEDEQDLLVDEKDVDEIDLSFDDESEEVSFNDFEKNEDLDNQVSQDELDFDVAFESPLELKEPSKAPVLKEKPVVKGQIFDLGTVEKNAVKSIDYNAFQSGGAFVISTTGKIDYSTELVPETKQYIVKLKNTSIDRKLSRPFLTKDFRQSFEAMNSYTGDDGSVSLVFQLKEVSNPRVSVFDGKILVEPGLGLSASSGGLKTSDLVEEGEENLSLSATSFEDFLLGKSKFVGEPVSLQAKDEDVVTIIQFIASEVGANIVLSEGVTGKISIKLKEVPWDQALVTIMKAKGLGYVRSGNILRVASLSELQEESKAAAAIQEARKTLSPFHVKVFPLSYASPSVIEEKIKPFLTQAASGGSSTGSNPRVGQVLSEARSSSLIVRDTLEVIENITALIKEMDRPPLQVMIQAKIVEAAKNFSKEIAGALNNNFNSTTVGGDIGARGSIFAGVENSATSTSFIPEVSIGSFDFFGTLTARLRLQEIKSKAKVLSSPSVLVINNETANILQSDQILNEVATTTDQATAITVESTPVELSLDVTPQVSADSNISLEIEVKRDFSQEQQLGNTVSSRSAKTKVLIENNKTAMIGGIYQVTENESESGAPVLRKIPLLGWLFKGTSRSKVDTELVIFVTPRVVNQSSMGNQWADQKLKPSNGESVSKF